MCSQLNGTVNKKLSTYIIPTMCCQSTVNKQCRLRYVIPVTDAGIQPYHAVAGSSSVFAASGSSSL